MSFRHTAFVALLSTQSLFSQVAGRLTGSVVDSTGAGIPAASIQLVREDGGVAAIQTATGEGFYSFAAIQQGSYELRVEAAGFAPGSISGIKIDAARETSLLPLELQPSTLVQSIDVVAPPALIQTNNAEISTTVSNEQVRRLPQLNRNILSLISTQAGVGFNNRTPTSIHGMRPSYSNVSLDGVNIQDNLFRENSLDFLPPLLLLDQVSEMTVVTSNAPSAMGNGAAQVAFVTPSGSNTFHGGAYWYNRNNALAANGFFENQSGLSLPFLNQNQGGGYLGGRIVKDKLFFYVNYEAFRRRQQVLQQRTVLTESARRGIFTYDTPGGLAQRNILQLAGVSGVNPFIQNLIDQTPGADEINNLNSGDSTLGAVRNTGGYSFLQRSNRDRDNVLGKLDYYASDRHSFFGSYAWNRDTLDRPNLNQNGFTTAPQLVNDNPTNFTSAGWRSTLSATFTNELRGGFNFTTGNFDRTVPDEPYYVTDLSFSNPVQNYPGTGRATKTWNLSDNANWVNGRHSISFGFQAQNIRVNTYDRTNIVPSYRIGLVNRDEGLTADQLPGISANALLDANRMLASLAGFLDQVTQTFNVESTTSGFVSGAAKRRIFTFATYAGYFQDNWKIHPRLSLNMGLRYDYFTRVNESRNLALLPVLADGNVINTLLSNSTLDFAGNGIGRPWYGMDLNNFAPNIGLAWNVRGDGKTAIRMGYSVNFVNDNHVATLQNGPDSNDGLAFQVTELVQTDASNPRPASTPAFKVPRTFSENYALNTQTAFASIDPNLRTPYVQQWNFGIQQEIKGGVFEARYVGNHATKQFRAFDYNQVNIGVPGYMDDFRRARNNGMLAFERTGRFDPAYNEDIAGSQPLPFFAQLPNGGFLNNPTVQSYILANYAGELANTYQTAGLNGNIDFYRNPYALGTNLLTNFSNSSYHAFQADYRRRFRQGYSFQVNYTWSKSLSDAGGDNQVNFEPMLDINNARLERAPTPFDLRHAIKGNFVLDLPFGNGRRFLNGSGPILSRLAGGWALNGMTTWQTGFPFSIRSQRPTLNRGARSANNTAVSTLDWDALSRAVGFYMTGNGPYMVDQIAINSDGRGVASDLASPFPGQIFFNPGAGELGTLQRRMFTGPSYFNFDFGIQKVTTITEGHTLEFRMEAFNLFNNVSFDTVSPPNFDYNINSPGFGRLVNQSNSPRVIQFGLYYRF